MPSKKSDLLKFLEPKYKVEVPKTYNCKVFDGAVITHSLPVAAASTFNEYADIVFIPYLLNQSQRCKRVDVVWDTYFSDSIKTSTREKRGTGTRRKVSGDTKLPRKWMEFLRDPDNKKELNAYLRWRLMISKTTRKFTLLLVSTCCMYCYFFNNQRHQCRVCHHCRPFPYNLNDIASSFQGNQ